MTWQRSEPREYGSWGRGRSVPLLDPYAYDLSADGSTVVAWEDGDLPTVFVADATTGRIIWSRSIPDFQWPLASVSSDGSRVAVLDQDNRRLRTFDVTSGTLVAETRISDVDDRQGSFFYGRPQFSPGDAYIDVTTVARVARLSATDLQLIRRVDSPFHLLGDLAHVPGTDDVVAAGVAGQIARWNLSTGELVAGGQSQNSSDLTDVAVSPDGSLVAAAHASSRRMAVFHAATLLPIGEPFPVGDRTFVPQLTPDGLLGHGLFNDVTVWTINPDTWEQTACTAANRNLTEHEWVEYIGPDEPPRPTCPSSP